MTSSESSVQAFDQFRDENPGWQQMTPYSIARTFWDAGVQFGKNEEDPVYEVQTVVIDQDGDEWDEVMSESIETAREDAAEWRESDAPEDGEKIVIRTRRKAGPWTIVPDEEKP